MKKYKAYIKQIGEGCDYTIGCAQTVIDIQAESMMDAVSRFIEIVKESYSYDESRLGNAEIYEIDKVHNVDLKKIYNEIDFDKKTANFMQKELEDLKEYERLKKKFG